MKQNKQNGNRAGSDCPQVITWFLIISTVGALSVMMSSCSLIPEVGEPTIVDPSDPGRPPVQNPAVSHGTWDWIEIVVGLAIGRTLPFLQPLTKPVLAIIRGLLFRTPKAPIATTQNAGVTQ